MNRIITAALLVSVYIMRFYASSPLPFAHSFAMNKVLSTPNSTNNNTITQEFDHDFWYNILEQKAWIVRSNDKYRATYHQPPLERDATKEFLRSLLQTSPGLVLTYPGLRNFLQR